MEPVVRDTVTHTEQAFPEMDAGALAAQAAAFGVSPAPSVAQAALALKLAHGDANAAMEMLLDGAIPADPGAGMDIGGVPAGVWEYDDGPKGWQQIGGPTDQAAIEAAHQAGQTAYLFSFGRFHYQIDLHRMVCHTYQCTRAWSLPLHAALASRETG